MTARRQLLQSAGAPSGKIVFGGIGIGSRGAHDLSKILKIKDARFVAICDVRNSRREEIKSIADKNYGDNGCQMYSDQYEILARRDIDAVLIATGDRWPPLSIIAAQHGKDVYCEKPCSMSIEESWALAALLSDEHLSVYDLPPPLIKPQSPNEVRGRHTQPLTHTGTPPLPPQTPSPTHPPPQKSDPTD